jgi:hypothetical protein
MEPIITSVDGGLMVHPPSSKAASMAGEQAKEILLFMEKCLKWADDIRLSVTRG